MHAYLIIAHGQWKLLKRLLCELDDKENSIYIHIDSLVQDVPFDDLKKAVKISDLHFVKRVPVYWGTFSIGVATLELLKESTIEHYDYYHLISGQDFPLKTQREIHSFFSEHRGVQFINAYMPDKLPQNFRDRVEKYHFMVKSARDKRIINRCIFKFVDSFVGKIQMSVGLNRLKKYKYILLSGGSTWFSITDEFAHYICNNEKLIRELFEKNTYTADEMFVQTMAFLGGYEKYIFDPKKENLAVSSNLRLIDWKRGTPYVWRKVDYEELVNSHALFARKFDQNTDMGIVDMIAEFLLQKNCELY